LDFVDFKRVQPLWTASIDHTILNHQPLIVLNPISRLQRIGIPLRLKVHIAINILNIKISITWLFAESHMDPTQLLTCSCALYIAYIHCVS